MEVIITIAVLIGIFAAATYIDVISSKRFKDDIKEKYPSIDSYENIYVTENRELLYYLPSGALGGYKKWNLDDIAYICVYKGDFCLYDINKEKMPGEYLTPSNKKYLKEQSYVTFSVGRDKVNVYVDFIKKHGTHIQDFEK